MFKRFLLSLFLVLFALALPVKVKGAGDLLIQNSAVMASSSSALGFLESTAKLSDNRVYKLHKFLDGHNSPIAEYAEEFVYYADKYELDWRLVPAISGVESTFGKHIPANSFNAYGWAGGKYRFDSWEDSIEVVSKALREKYYDRGANTVYKIGRIYCPPNPAWGGKVSFFMNKIDSNPIAFSL